MRKFLIAACLAAGPAMSATEMVARNGDDSIRIVDATCETASVLRHIPEAKRKEFRKADGRVGGQRYFACWIQQGEQVFVVWEDGDLGMIPVSDFKEPKNI
jgi:hypothetical protein